MGFFSSIFGGDEWKQIPGAQGYIDPIEQFNPLMYGESLGIGPEGRNDKQTVNQIKAGHLEDTAPMMAAQQAVNASYAGNDKTRNRAMAGQMGLMGQAGQMAAMQGDLQRQSNQDKSNTLGQLGGNVYQNALSGWGNAWQGAQNRRQRAAEDKLGADQLGFQDYKGSMYQQHTPGILDDINKVASTAGNVASLGLTGDLSSLFGSGGGGGG